MILPDARNQDVILEIVSHARKVLRHLDAGPGQLALVTDARLHQHLRRVDRAERKHGLVASRDPMEGSGSRRPLSNGLGKASKRQSRSVLRSAGH